MKHIIISAALLFATALGATAQTTAETQQQRESREQQEAIDILLKENKKLKQKEQERKIWGKGRFLKLGYSLAQTGADMQPVEKSKYGFFLSKGTTYRFPTIAGMIKIGIDAVWFDATFAKYKSPYEDLMSGAWTSELEEINGSDYGDDDDEDLLEKLNVGRMSVTLGAFGIGPNISVAPFAFLNNGLSCLRASVYFHYQPAMSLYLKSENGDIELAPAFCNMFDFGGMLTYRAISLGVEGRWGKGKFKPIGFNTLFIGDDSEEKVTRKFANTRLYISFAF